MFGFELIETKCIKMFIVQQPNNTFKQNDFKGRFFQVNIFLLQCPFLYGFELFYIKYLRTCICCKLFQEIYSQSPQGGFFQGGGVRRLPLCKFQFTYFPLKRLVFNIPPLPWYFQFSSLGRVNIFCNHTLLGFFMKWHLLHKGLFLDPQDQPWDRMY